MAYLAREPTFLPLTVTATREVAQRGKPDKAASVWPTATASAAPAPSASSAPVGTSAPAGSAGSTAPAGSAGPTGSAPTAGATTSAAGVHDTDARTVHEKAEAANTAAAHCWTALLAGCDGPGRWELVDRLRELSEATSAYAGTRWWLTDGAVHRRRVAEAEGRIEEAIREGDGAEFAEAFAGYDQAVATAVVCVHSRLGSSTT